MAQAKVIYNVTDNELFQNSREVEIKYNFDQRNVYRACKEQVVAYNKEWKFLHDLPKDQQYYVYLHYKGDTDHVFYVGQGTNGRAWTWENRNQWWMRCAKKNSRKVVLIKWGISQQGSLDLETQLIKEYQDKGMAECNILPVNKSKAPTQEFVDKCRNAALKQHFELTPEQRKTRSENGETSGIYARDNKIGLFSLSSEEKSKLGYQLVKYNTENKVGAAYMDADDRKIHSDKLRTKLGNPVYCPELDKEFPSIRFAAKECNTFSEAILAVLAKKKLSAGKHPETGVELHWCLSSDKDNFVIPVSSYNYGKIYCPELGLEFESLTAASKYVPISISCIHMVLKGKQKAAGKHPITKKPLTWEYK